MLSEHADGAGGEGGLLSALGVPYRAGGAPGRYGLTPPSAQPGRRPLAGGGAVLALRPPPTPVLRLWQSHNAAAPPRLHVIGGGVLPAGGGRTPPGSAVGGGGGALLHSIAAHCNAVCNRQHSAVRFFRGVGREQTATPPNKYIPLPPPQCCVAQSWGQEGGLTGEDADSPPHLGLPPALCHRCVPKGGGAGGVSAAVATTVQSSDSDSPFFGHLVVFFKGGVSFFFLFFGGGVVVVCLCDCWGRVWGGGGLLNTEKLIMGGFFGTAGGRRVLGRLRRWAHTLIVMLGE